MHKHDRALESLLCATLRDANIITLYKRDLDSYCANLGIALHNLPAQLREDGMPGQDTLYILNSLDPSGTKTQWGGWCKTLFHHIDQPLPDTPPQNLATGGTLSFPSRK